MSFNKQNDVNNASGGHRTGGEGIMKRQSAGEWVTFSICQITGLSSPCCPIVVSTIPGRRPFCADITTVTKRRYMTCHSDIRGRPSPSHRQKRRKFGDVWLFFSEICSQTYMTLWLQYSAPHNESEAMEFLIPERHNSKSKLELNEVHLNMQIASTVTVFLGFKYTAENCGVLTQKPSWLYKRCWQLELTRWMRSQKSSF